MLEVIHLKKYFNRHTASEVLALDDCSLKINDGEFVMLIGSNGSGKSTLLNLMAGTYLPETGKILIDNHDVTNKKDFQRSKWIARVFQDPMAGTAADLTIIDNFRLAALRTKNKTFKMGADRHFKNKVRERLSVLNFGLENKLETIVGKLSGGQRQALTLLMSVMDDSKILLLDEPTAALDPRSSENIIMIANNVISELHLTAVFVTHNMHTASAFGSRLIMMHGGKILKDLSGVQKSDLKASSLLDWFNFGFAN